MKWDLEHITFGEYAFVYPYLTEDSREGTTQRLKDAPKPKKFCGVEVPKDLNLCTYGTLCEIQTAASKNGGDIVGIARAVFPDLDAKQISKERAVVVFGVVQWISKECERINKLFSALQPRFSAEQVEAGFSKLNFGTFGVLDAYAKRQGIKDQDEVLGVRWVRIYTCFKNDMERAECERRLQEIYSRKIRH